jgi:hypothetical protein
MSKNKTPTLYQGRVDPNGGYLCMWVYWRPNPDDPNPEVPSLKQSMTTYIPAKPSDPCLCGSGKRFRDCCRARPYWHPVCPNPDAESYSLLAPQEVMCKNVNSALVREHLMEDVRLQCVDDTINSAFWVYWGDPALDTLPYGTLCFGDIELKRNRTLYVTAMSDLRMQTLLTLLHDVLGDEFKPSPIRYDAVTVIDKQTGEQVKMHPARQSRGK